MSDTPFRTRHVVCRRWVCRRRSKRWHDSVGALAPLSTNLCLSFVVLFLTYTPTSQRRLAPNHLQRTRGLMHAHQELFQPIVVCVCLAWARTWSACLSHFPPRAGIKFESADKQRLSVSVSRSLVSSVVQRQSMFSPIVTHWGYFDISLPSVDTSG